LPLYLIKLRILDYYRGEEGDRHSFFRLVLDADGRLHNLTALLPEK